MKTVAVQFVRIYLMEGSGTLNQIVHHLKEEVQVRGLSVFRAIGGFGSSGEHSLSMLDMSVHLPLVVEFFDSADKVATALEYLQGIISEEHILILDAKANA